ncbi:hypothetical protein PIB30_066439 [Stylosanthes scabra]|uniref:Ribonuclease H1 N-terminal domain-containing protein n=1 Tax=Stylosanthes scabra TaxID=79078 RepID=A0ABU6YP50_9FABA|nr:hypothetical protein [Stylosanthes scabra]
MEPFMQQFSYFAVTKGFRPGVYSSFEEANQQIINFLEPEYQGFNSLLLANDAFEERMFCIQCDKDAVAEQLEAMEIRNPSPPTTPRTFPTREGRLSPLVDGITWLPADVSAPYPFALNNSMEKWLERVCSKSSISPACIQKASRMVTRADPDCEDRRFIATRRLWPSTDGVLFRVRQHWGQGEVQINEIIVRRLNHASENHVWLVDSFDNCLELFLTVQGGHMLISTADLHRVQHLYRLDDNPGLGPYLLEVRYVDLGIFFIVVIDC